MAYITYANIDSLINKYTDIQIIRKILQQQK